MTHASIIICTYNRSDSLQRTLKKFESLLTPKDFSFDIIVVDNNSSDDTRTVTENFIRLTKLEVKYIFEKKQGKSFALNRGIIEANGEIIAFTDDDILVRHDWLVNIIKAFYENECVCVGGKIILRLEKTRPEWLTGKLMEQLGFLDLGNVSFLLTQPKLYGANFAVKKTVFKKYGYFDEELGPKGNKMYNNEDIHFVSKLIDGGERVVYSPDIIVEHVIPLHHIRKSYFRKRMYDQGVIKGISMGKYENRKFMEIPLYVMKEFVISFFEFIYLKFTTPKESFHKEVSLSERIGFIVGRIKYATFR
jgi:glycosyltransferase involved in cell wall biosynthesis